VWQPSSPCDPITLRGEIVIDSCVLPGAILEDVGFSVLVTPLG
jgi:hypothetical protein